MNSSKFQKEVLDRLDKIISLLEKEEKPQENKDLVENDLLATDYKLVPDGYHYEYHLEPDGWRCKVILDNEIN